VTFDGDRVALTNRGRLLCRSHPSSIQAAFATIGLSDVAHALTDTLRTGRAAASSVLGAPYWDYLTANPGERARFDQAMRQRAPALSLACVPVLDWPATGTIADVAGGVGTLLAAVLLAAPGVLHPGDLFEPPPPADLYLLANVLHDWDDERAASILAALARAATDATRLRIFEMLLPDDAAPHRARMSDVSMPLLFDGARERTAGEFQLLERSGWRLDRVVGSQGPMSVIEASRSGGGV
jgi:hypothetical protein